MTPPISDPTAGAPLPGGRVRSKPALKKENYLMTTAATLAALDAVQESAAALATAVQDVKDALVEEPPTLKVGDRVRITASPLSPNTHGPGYIGHVGTLTKIERDLPRRLSRTGVRYAVSPYWYAGEVELVEAAPEPTPAPEQTPTRVEIRTTDDRERVVAAEPGIHGEGSVYLAVSAYGDRCAAWLSRDEARQLAATLTAIADTP